MARRARKVEEGNEPPPRPDIVEGAPHPAETRHLFGQEAAEAAFLSASRTGRLPHGWLLRGPAGVGKATLAYRIARAVLAEDAPPGTLEMPKGCPVAARIRAGSEPGLRVLRRGVNPSTGNLRTEIVVEDVRAIRTFLQQTRPDGGWRVILVDPADEMNPNAANAFLKMLEEPPERVLMLLLAHAPSGLLPTIRSRCRSLDLAPLGPEALAEALAGAGHPVAPDQAGAVVALSGGSVGGAVRLLALGGLETYARIVAMMEGGRLDRAEMLALSETREAERARLMVRLAQTLIARLARAGAAGSPPEAAPGEGALMADVAVRPAQARLWAEAAPRIAGAARHALAVNLDPAQTILDMFLDIDAVLARARSA